jgi:hypothetical protein
MLSVIFVMMVMKQFEAMNPKLFHLLMKESKEREKNEKLVRLLIEI